MVEYGFALHPGTEAFLSVSPTAIVADRAIHGMPREKRQCYLSKEKELAFFRHYTFLNCFMECAANFTFEVESCCPFLFFKNVFFNNLIFKICFVTELPIQ